MHATRKELEHVRQSISRLKKDILQLRKLLKRKHSHELLLRKTREVRKVLKTQTMRTPIAGLLLHKYSDIGHLLLKQKNHNQ